LVLGFEISTREMSVRASDIQLHCGPHPYSRQVGTSLRSASNLPEYQGRGYIAGKNCGENGAEDAVYAVCPNVESSELGVVGFAVRICLISSRRIVIWSMSAGLFAGRVETHSITRFDNPAGTFGFNSAGV
jgi:hypothetical protein